MFHVIPLVIYPFDVVFSFGESDKVLLNKVKHNMSEEDYPIINFKSENNKGRYVMFTNGCSLIRLRNKPSTPKDYGYLQHEIFHAVTYILDKIGMEFKLYSSDEAYTYLIQYLTTEIYKKLKF